MKCAALFDDVVVSVVGRCNAVAVVMLVVSGVLCFVLCLVVVVVLIVVMLSVAFSVVVPCNLLFEQMNLAKYAFFLFIGNAPCH